MPIIKLKDDWTKPIIPEDFILDKKEGITSALMWIEDHQLELENFLDEYWDARDHEGITTWFKDNPRMTKALLIDDFKDNGEKIKEIIREFKKGKSKIVLIVGGRGSGKTATALWLAEQIKKERPVYVCGNAIKSEDLPEWIKTEQDAVNTPVGSLVILDEAGIVVSARESNQKSSIILTKHLLTLRHENKSIIFMTQHTKIADVNLSRLAEIIMFKQPITSMFDTERGSNVKNWHNLLIKVLMPTSKKETLFIMNKRIMKFYQPLPTFWSDIISKSWRGHAKKEKERIKKARLEVIKRAREEAKRPKCPKCYSKEIRYVRSKGITYCRRCGNQW